MSDMLPELDTRSLLHVIEENFARVNLKTYACRMIYAGEHNLKSEDIMKIFDQTVKDVNAGYCDIHVYGLLLVYENYFIHILEGSEDTIHRQIRFLLKHEESFVAENSKVIEGATDQMAGKEAQANQSQSKMFKRMKLLIVYHSITTRIFTTWRAMSVHPPALVTKLDIYAPMAQHFEQLKICLEKVKNTCQYVSNADASFTLDSLCAADHKTIALPEGALLDFLLSSKYILDLREVYRMHRRVDDYVFYSEEVWPLQTHHTPRHMFKLEVDDSFVEPLPVMPWEVKDNTEDEEREEKTSQSSGD